MGGTPDSITAKDRRGSWNGTRFFSRAVFYIPRLILQPALGVHVAKHCEEYWLEEEGRWLIETHRVLTWRGLREACAWGSLLEPVQDVSGSAPSIYFVMMIEDVASSEERINCLAQPHSVPTGHSGRCLLWTSFDKLRIKLKCYVLVFSHLQML